MWAKASPSEGTRHPLLWHLLDVAALAERLWDVYVSRAFRSRFQSSLSLSDERQARAWFAWFAAMHDLGKASPYFQGQVPFAAERVKAAGLRVAAREVDHEHVGAYVLADLMEHWGAPYSVALTWATAVNIFHGRTPIAADLNGVALQARCDLYVEYRPIIREVMVSVREAVGATEDVDWGALTSDLPVLVEAAGVIKASDWMGSSDKMFPYLDEPMEPSAYMERARRFARAASWANTLMGWRLPDSPMPFSRQFGFEPRALQSATLALAETLPLESMLVIEAPMGMGKTEAALSAAHTFARKGAQGLYFALPTRATARAMHGRVSQWLEDTGLSTRGPILNAGDWNIKPPEVEEEDFTSPDTDGQAVRERTEPSLWFRGPHRPLLAKVGVGTVDQVLLSAQPVRYCVARWAGLSGRVVVFDEVHAYDAFMNEVFARALQWLGRLGCPVILLSATLPSESRQRFVNAYLSGLRGRKAHEEVMTQGYPVVTAVTSEGVQTLPIAPPSDRSLTIESVAVTEDASASLAQIIAGRVGGEAGVVAVVCNTVDRAVEVSQSLSLMLPEAEIVLLHSRFTARDRATQTAKVMQAAGKGGLGRREGRLQIVVATQIIEQSIDVDFDWMVSEVAPVDLVLQRSGRLHRWEGTPRPAWASKPVLTVASGPLTEDGVPDLRLTSFVYHHEMPAITLSSWAHLQSITSLPIPSGIPALVESVYGNEPPPLGGRGLEQWRTALSIDKETVTKGTSSAKNLTLPSPWMPAKSAWYSFGEGKTEDEGGRYRSRGSEDESVLVALAYEVDGALVPVSTSGPAPLSDQGEWRYSCVSVSGSVLRIMGEPVTPVEWKTGPLRDARLHVLSPEGSLLYSSREGLTRLSSEV